MEYFRFVPPSIISFASATFFLSVVSAMPSPQAVEAPAAAAPQTRQLNAAAPPQPQSRFLPFFQRPQTNPNQQLQNTLAAGGLGAVGGVAATQCLFGGNCDLSFRPSLGAAVDANGKIVPQLGVTTQVGNGPLAPTFTGGLQLDQNSQNGIGGFVAGGVNNGDPNSISPGVQTGFGFSQGQNGQTQATAQLGGNIQAPSLAGINFGQQGRPGSIGGAQPTLFNQPLFAALG